MAEFICICGNTLTIDARRPCVWCDRCGERMFPEYAALAEAVAALKEQGARAASPEEMLRLHTEYLDLVLDRDMLKLGFEVDLGVSRRLLAEAAEICGSAMLWYTLGNTYKSAGYPARIEWFERGARCAQKGSADYKNCLLMAAHLHELMSSRSYSLAALGHYRELFELDPSNAPLAMTLYRGYKAAWEDLGNDSYYTYKEHYLRLANSLGSYDARAEIDRIVADREAQDILDSERRRADAEAIANKLYEEMFESRGSAIIRSK